MPKRKPSSNPITDHFKSQRYTHNQLSGLGDSMARGHYFNMVDRTQRWLNRTENQVNALYSQNKLPSGCYHSSSTGSSTSNENRRDRPDHNLDGSSNNPRDPAHLRVPDSGRALLEKMICERHSKTTSQHSAWRKANAKQHVIGKRPTHSHVKKHTISHIQISLLCTPM